MFQKRNNKKTTLAPSIRLFISSTFIDMEEEREALKKRVFPHIRDLCETHGISFFPIDLRWGISEEKQQTGAVATTCLKEVDNCRPYFLGIIGNRYGTVVNDKQNNVWKEFKSLSRFFARSITELEIRYGCFSPKNPPLFAHFYFNENPSDVFADGNPLLSQLISDIKRNSDYSTYNGIEDFVAKTTVELEHLVYELAEKLGDAQSAKQAWFLCNNTIPSRFTTKPRNDLDGKMFEGHSILLYSSLANGKSTYLNHFVSEKSCNQIIINLLADPFLWNGIHIIEYIQKEIETLYPNIKKFDLIDSEKSKDGKFFANLKTFLSMPNTGETKTIYSFSKWLENIEPSSPLILLINDINLINTEDLSFFLSFLPRETSKKFQILISTNNVQQYNTAKAKGILCVDFQHTITASDTIKEELKKHGKELSSQQLYELSKNPIYHVVSNAITVCKILVSCSSFLKIDALVQRLANAKDIDELFSIAMGTIESVQSEFKSFCQSALLFISLSNYGLSESSLLSLLEKKYNINQMEFLEVCQFVRIFCSVYNNRFFVISNDIRTKIFCHSQDYDIHAMQVLLGNECERHIDNAPTRSEKSTYLFEQIIQYKSAQSWDKLYETISDIKKLEIIRDVNWSIIRSAWLELLLATDYSPTEAYNGFLTEVHDYTSKIASSNFDITSFDSQKEKLRPIGAKIEALFADLYLWRECSDQTPIQNKQFFIRFISEIGSHTVFVRDEVNYILSAFDQHMIDDEQLKSQIDLLLSANNNDWEKAFLYEALYGCYSHLKQHSILHINDKNRAFDHAINSSFATGDISFVARIAKMLLSSKNNYTLEDLNLGRLVLEWTLQIADVPSYFSSIVLFSRICIQLNTKLEEAESFLKKAMILAPKVHREQMIPIIIYSLLDIYEKQNAPAQRKAILQYLYQNYESFLSRLSELPKYSFETHDRFSNISAITSMGELLIDAKCFLPAEKCFEIATSLCSALNYDTGCISSIKTISAFYLNLGDRGKAKTFLDQHLAHAIKHCKLLPIYHELLDEIINMRDNLDLNSFQCEILDTLKEENGICKAEDLLFSWIDMYPLVDFRNLAKVFYELLSKKTNQELIANNFSKEEVVEGYNEVLKKYEV